MLTEQNILYSGVWALPKLLFVSVSRCKCEEQVGQLSSLSKSEVS